MKLGKWTDLLGVEVNTWALFNSSKSLMQALCHFFDDVYQKLV